MCWGNVFFDVVGGPIVGHKRNKQMTRLKYLFDAPVKNIGLSV